jgi:hypothetical protein
MNSKKTDQSSSHWLLLIHQLPPKPAYFRVKMWRRIQRLGAVGIKNSVYALPNNEASMEAFHWVLKEIVAGGGDAFLCESKFIEGFTDQQVINLFNQVRSKEYNELIELARKNLSGISEIDFEGELKKLRHRLTEIIAIDFYQSDKRLSAEKFLDNYENKWRKKMPERSVNLKRFSSLKEFENKTWVTRKSIHIDRMASAWLIKRFINIEAKFKFVETKEYAPKKNELRFDMFEAEFTHEGDMCTFEVLVTRLNLKDNALKVLAEIIHDIDLNDQKYQRDEAIGVSQIINGVISAHATDEARLNRSSAIFDDLYENFKQKRK